MEDQVNDIADAAIAAPVAEAEAIPAAPLAAPAALEAEAIPAAAPKLKGKPGRPRKAAVVVPAPPAPAMAVEAPVAPAAKPVRKAAAKAAAKAPALPVKTTRKLTPKKLTPKNQAVSVKSAAPKQKDTFIMTAEKTTEVTETIQTAMKEAAAKAKAAFEKSQAAMGDMGTFTKGNVEAVVESTKILATGLQEMTKGYVAETKTVVETLTADVKDLASVKSPTEFFEKQNALLRKQFDAAVAASSKNSEAMLKLASEAFQPISNRVSLAVEKIKQAA